MKKYCYGIALVGLILGVGVCGALAAEQDVPDPMKATWEMQKNIAWTVEGLYQLGKSTDKALRLTPAQAKRILPLYKELITRKIIRLQLERNRGGRKPSGSEPDRVAGPPPIGKEGPSDGGPGGNPQQHQARMEQKAALIAFGNAKMEAINRVLTKKQVSVIDNWDFKAEKYGFPDFSHRASGHHPGGNSQFGGAPHLGRRGQAGNNPSGGPNMRRRDFVRHRPMNPRMEAGRKLLVKLNQDVLKMLQNYK